MHLTTVNCNPWEFVDGQAPWEPNPCQPPFIPDAPPNGYMAACIYSPGYDGDEADQLRTPTFDFTEMTNATLLFEQSAVEQIWGRVVLYNAGVAIDTLAVYSGVNVTPPSCGLVLPEMFDLSPYCGPGFNSVYVAFEVAHDEPCGIPIPTYQDWFVDNVRVIAQDLVPPAVANVTVTPTGPNTHDLTWAAPGDDGNLHRAQLYNVRYGPVPITPANWRHSLWVRPDMVNALPVPADPGAQEALTVRRLVGGEHHFSVRTLDEVNNIGPVNEGGANHPPAQTAPATVNAETDDWITFQVTAVDPDFDPLFMTAPLLPSTAVYEDQGGGVGEFNWFADEIGSIPVVFHARDWNGAIDADTTWIRVIPNNVAPDYADHDTGTCLFTVTNQGILGFLDATHADGSGFVYPESSGENHIYIGGLWVGLDPSYVASRDYDADPEKGWVASDSIRTDDYGYSPQDLGARYTDVRMAQSRGLEVSQSSWAYTSPPSDDDFVILRFRVTNRGGMDLADLSLGTFVDFDIRDQGSDDWAGTDAGRSLAWMTDPSGTYVGVRMLAPPTGGLPVENLTLVDNPTYVYPLQYITQADKYAFLTAADAAHIMTDGPNPQDYSVLVSAGPFDLVRGDQREVAFAIIGGGSLSELQQNADRAQAVYAVQSAGAPDSPARLTTSLLPNAPNPFAGATRVRFTLARRSSAEIAVYDVEGRLVRRLIDGPRPAGEQEISWDGRDARGRSAAAGVYFLRMRSAEGVESRPILRIR